MISIKVFNEDMLEEVKHKYQLRHRHTQGCFLLDYFNRLINWSYKIFLLFVILFYDRSYVHLQQSSRPHHNIVPYVSLRHAQSSSPPLLVSVPPLPFMQGSESSIQTRIQGYDRPIPTLS